MSAPGQPRAESGDAELLEDFRNCSAAEEYFTLLGVPYDPHVLSVNRLHILRYFAEELVTLHRGRTEPESPAEVLVTYREALARSYAAFTSQSALDHRLFKVLRDRAPEAFVPASAVVAEGPANRTETAR